MIRVAAVGDIHVGRDSQGREREQYAHLAERADVLLLAGDLTKCGTVDEASVLAEELADVGVPVVAVLGNHDHHAGEADEVVGVLSGAGVCVLEGESVTLPIGDGSRRLGIAGVKGFGGGFAGACATAFGEGEMKAFVRHTEEIAARLGDALAAVRSADGRVALLHYAPIEATLRGERLEIYPFLGAYQLAEAVDSAAPDLVVHGHAHNGSERGVTPGGIPVRNVARPVLRSAYRVFCIGSGDVTDDCGVHDEIEGAAHAQRP